MQNQGDYREEKQQVDQTSGDVEHSKAADPSYQQYNEQYRPDTHFLFLLMKCGAGSGWGAPGESYFRPARRV
jgi:hypothetical protein